MVLYGVMGNLVDKLNRAVAACDTNQSRLSRQTGIAQTTISAILSGERRPRFEHVAQLARPLGLSLDYLADDAQDEPVCPPTASAAARTAARMAEALQLTEDQVIRALNAATGAAQPYRQGDPIPGHSTRPGRIPSQAEANAAERKRRVK